jgi:hypothetical protein
MSTNMADRKSLIQVKFRFRKDLLARVQREAKRHHRSTDDEIARLIEEGLECGDWREDRQRLIAAMITDLRSHPNPAATKAAFQKMEQATERDHQQRMMEKLFSTKQSKPAPSPSPDELVTQSREAKRQRHEKRIDAITRRRRGR